MMKPLLLACVLWFAPAIAHAALPPLWHDAAELQAILSSQQLPENLASGESIVKIKRFDKGWLIVTNKGKVPVFVIYKEQSMPGKGEFTLNFGKRRAFDLK